MALKLKQDDQATINLTPLIDIVFLLIIFFMVGTKFSELDEAEKNLALQVPQVSDAKALTDVPDKRQIQVLQDGSIVFDQQTLTPDELLDKLNAAKREYPRMGVVVRGDGKVHFERVAEVMATCRKADIDDLNMAVQQRPSLTR